VAALIYCCLRLPDCMPYIKTVVLGQSFPVSPSMVMAGWKPGSPCRRRRAAGAAFLMEGYAGLLYRQPFGYR